MFPQIYNSSGQRLAVLDNIVQETASIKRVVNGEFTFEFEAYEKELKSEYFNKDNSLVIDNQTFDIKYVEQKHDVDVIYKIQCEHVNYRLGDGIGNLYPLYVYTGTPTQILSNILSGTSFSVGTVSYAGVMTLTVNAEITKKALIYELANALGGEIEYTNNGFTINLLNSIGWDNGFAAMFGKNLKGVSKIIDNRGELKTYYDVDIIALKNSNEYIANDLQSLDVIGVGDTIRIIDEVIGLDIENRVISIDYNPIFELNTKLEIANTIELITNKITQIARSTVSKEALYNGVKIGPDEGFVATRSDNKTKTVMNATEGISLYSDTGSGLVRNFFVDTYGRIQGKYLVIDQNSDFHGEVNISNGGTVVSMAPTGGLPFEIKYGANSIMSVDNSGNANFKGTITASTINGGTVNGATVNSGVVNGATINGAIINGGSIDVETDIYMGGQLHLSGTNFGAGITWDNGHNGIYIDPAGYAMTLSASYLYWGADLIATRSWVSSQINAAIGYHIAAYHSGP